MWLKLSTLNEDQQLSVSREKKIIEKRTKKEPKTTKTTTKRKNPPKNTEKLHY